MKQDNCILLKGMRVPGPGYQGLKQPLASTTCGGNVRNSTKSHFDYSSCASMSIASTICRHTR